MASTFTNVYRRGGYLNAEWIRVLTNHATREAALTEAAELERMGYKTLTRPTSEWDRIGLPVGYCSKCCGATGECRKATTECRTALEAINA